MTGRTKVIAAETENLLVLVPPPPPHSLPPKKAWAPVSEDMFRINFDFALTYDA